jgi:hypothetical protein
MLTREDLIPWLEDALKALGGRGTIVSVCKHVWENHEPELRSAGDMLYTWQYEIRWAAKMLRERKVMKAAEVSPKGLWELA